MEEIVRYACSAMGSPSFFASAALDISAQTRNAFIECGVDQAIFTEESSLKEKSKKIIDCIMARHSPVSKPTK